MSNRVDKNVATPMYEPSTLWGKIEKEAYYMGISRNTVAQWHSRGYVPARLEQRIAGLLRLKTEVLTKMRMVMLGRKE